MLRFGSLVACVSLGLALAGCGGSSESRAHANTLIVLDHSVGGVALNEQRAVVERSLGRGFVVKAGDQKPPGPTVHGEDVLYAKHGLEVVYISRNATPASRAHGRVVLVLTHSPRYRTPQGVHVGSTAAELHSIKGVDCDEPAGLDCQHGGHVHNQPGTTFRLDYPGGKVVRIAIARSD
jgi:hypothetical protein